MAKAQLIEFFTKTSFRGSIALIVILGDFLIVTALFLKAIPTGNRDAFLALGGVMVGLSPQVVSWYFGSSKEKADKERADAIQAAGI